MGKQVITIVLLWLVTTVNAQKAPLSFKQVDSTTYALYLKQDWKSVIELGKQARTEGIDFYYLKVRMGIAYFKEHKMLHAVQFLEEANAINSFDAVVQEYLYYAYIYSGLILESRLFYEKMNKTLKDAINLDLPFVTDLSFNVLATNNLDYNELLVSNSDAESGDIRFIPKNYQIFSLAMSHPLSKRVNLHHQLSVMPTNSVQQEISSGSLDNQTYKGSESRYYVDITISLGNRWYLDTYLHFISGKFDNLNGENTTISVGNGSQILTTSSSATLKYNDVVFGGAISKASYFIRNSINISVSNINGLNQFQAGYSMELYPLGSTLLVPFGAIQYQNQDPDSNVIFTGGLSVTSGNMLITGFGTVGNINNFVANKGAIIYNQPAKALNEFGATLQYFNKNSIFKIGYTFMEMEANYTDGNFEITSKTFGFNQQNIIAGITWKF